MPECAFTDLACQAGAAVLSPLESVARTVVDTNLDFLRTALTWWLRVDSINPDSGPIRALQAYTMPVAVAMLVGSVLVQAIRMGLARKKDPAINVALGLLRFAVVNAVGLALLTAALRGGDAYAVFLLENAGREYLDHMEVVILGLGLPLMVVLSSIGAILGAIQFVLAFFRQAGILVLAAMLPVAASGSINDSTKVWLSRTAPWLVTLVLYKPMAAFIYAIGFELMAAQDEEPFVIGFVGLFVILLAVVAMPAMMRFFAWSQVSMTGGSGVGGAIASGASGAATTASVLAARRQQTTGPASASAESSPPTGSAPAATGTAAGPGSGSPGSSGAGGGVAGGVAAVQMAYQAGKDTAEKFTSHVASGANGAPPAGHPNGRGGSSGTTAPAGGGSGVAAGAAASGAAGSPAAGSIAGAQAAQQIAQRAANRMTGEEPQR
jgi:type IV secretion system protein TrbL